MPQPTKIPRAFASSGDKNVIPESTGSIGLASWTEGFPAITSTPFAQGGIAPKRADFNGIFNALSAATVWQQQGGIWAYDNTTDYEVGNVVIYSGALYICLVANGPGSSIVAPTNTTTWSKISNAVDLSSYLPLAGGTMSDAIINNSTLAIRKPDRTGLLTLVGGDADNSAAGGKLYLYGSSSLNRPGFFGLQAGDANGYKQLFGAPDGTLTWDGDSLITATALGTSLADYLALAGGTMTGTIVSKVHPALCRNANNSYLQLSGGNDANNSSGAKLVLYGSSNTTSPGGFRLAAATSGLSKYLEGATDGTFTWGGSDIFTVDNCPIASSVGSDPYTYKAKFANGVMIQATYDNFTTNEYSRFDWVFPEAFYEFPFVTVLKVSASRSYNLYSCSKTLARIRVNDMSGASVGQSDTAHVMMIAVGRWK